MSATETKRVRLGSSTRCAKCDAVLSAGTIVVRRRWRALTYRERCHADAHGMVSSYTCEGHHS